jgi:hypothetical protein
MISDPVGRAKSVLLTNEGWRGPSGCFKICLRQSARPRNAPVKVRTYRDVRQLE